MWAPACPPRLRSPCFKAVCLLLPPLRIRADCSPVETLSLRVERHCQNTLALAKWLEQRPEVAWVSYPGLASHSHHEIAKKLLRPGHFGGVLSLGVKAPHFGGELVDRFRLLSHLANVGDAKSCVIAPATTIHGQLNDQEQEMAGVTKDTIRVSVGIEAIE